MTRRMALQMGSAIETTRPRERRRGALPPTPPYVSPTLRRFSSKSPESLETMLDGLTILRQARADYFSDVLSTAAGRLSGV